MADWNGYQQRQVGKSSGIPKDEGGHMIGTQFNGPGEGPLHMVPQSMNLNRGPGSKWTKMENKWVDALENGDTVVASVKVDWPPGFKRPAGMTFDYQLTNRRTRIKQEYPEVLENN